MPEKPEATDTKSELEKEQLELVKSINRGLTGAGFFYLFCIIGFIVAFIIYFFVC